MFSTNAIFPKYFWLRLIKYKGEESMATGNCVVIESNKCPQSSFVIVPCPISLAMSLCPFLHYLVAKPLPTFQFILVTQLGATVCCLSQSPRTFTSPLSPPAANH